MPASDHEEQRREWAARWQDVATENRVRIEGLEREAERQRLRTHELASQLSTVSLLGERVANLTAELHELGERFERLAKRALERPTPSAWSAGAGWLAVLVAVIALALSASHS